MCLLMLLCYSKIHLHQLGPFELIKTLLKSLLVLYGLFQVWNRYPKGSHNNVVTIHGLLSVQYSRMILKIEFSKNKYNLVYLDDPHCLN